MNVIEKKITDLKGSEYNPRYISEKQMTELKESIQKFGMTDPVLINSNPERLNVIIAGHQRVRACSELGIKKVPCVEIDLTLEKEKELNVRMNRSGGEFDFDLLNEYFDQKDLIDWGFEEFEFDIEKEIFEPNVNPEMSHKEVTPDDVKDSEKDITDSFENKGQSKAQTVVCPHCYKEFEIDA